MFVLAERDHSDRYTTIKPGFGEAMVVARLAQTAGDAVEWYIWVVDDVPVGWVVISWVGKPTLRGVPDLSDLFVTPARRKQGIGTAMLAACEELARSRGFTQLSLAVNPDHNPRALALYLRLGYRPTGTPKYPDGVDEGKEDWVIDLVKEIGPP